ncbi:MAG: DUF3793 family protein [Bacillota bacterium]|nr:DUF3793 family protein [Bacillota bacterium]
MCCNRIEPLLVKHGAPTLAGLKSGSLFVFSFASMETLREDIRKMNRRIVPKGLRLLPLRIREGRALLYVFRPRCLQNDLSDAKACAYLQQCGYARRSLNADVACLRCRVCQSAEFPHEIGLFLGYPPEDVLAFIEKGPKHCKLTGCWKVYHNPEQAKEVFARFKDCTRDYLQKWERGSAIEELTIAS